MGIEQRFAELSPKGQYAVLAFIEFLLSREEGSENHHGEEESDDFPIEGPAPGTIPVCEVSHTQETGKSSRIILAEERIVDENESIIDFADINSRFSKKDAGKEKSGQIRQRKMFDWL